MKSFKLENLIADILVPLALVGIAYAIYKANTRNIGMPNLETFE